MFQYCVLLSELAGIEPDVFCEGLGCTGPICLVPARDTKTEVTSGLFG